MANNTFQLKRSLVSGNVPNASQLSQGELAINIPDHRLFTKDESNTVVDVFGQSVNTSANVQFRNGTYTGNLSVTGTTSFTGNVSSSNTITGTQIISTVVNGTAPFQVTSNTLVLNLNADFLDGQTGAYYSNLQNSTNILSLDKGGSNSNLVPVAGGLVYSNTQGLSITVAGTTGQYLISNGTSTPVWKSPADLAVGYAWTVNNGVYTTGSYSDPAWITSLAASKVGLGNVTNESKATMFASPTFTGTVTATGSVTIGGNLTVQGTQFVVSTNNASYTAGVLSLHKPATGWITSNDGQDIGVVYENYDPAAYYQVISGGSANGSVATLRVPRGGAYFPGAWVTITNAAPAEFNGSFKVTATTSNTFSFALASSNTVSTTGQLGKSTRVTEFTITSGTTGHGDKISTINYTTPNLALTVGQVVTIYGCTPIEYNGTWTVLTATNGSFTFQNTQNIGVITVGGTVVIDNRRAFSGWSNDEKSFEFYKIGSQNPNGTFGGFYGVIKGAAFHAARSPSISNTELQTGIAFYTADANDSSIWDISTANNGTIGQVKTVSIGSYVLDATASNVHYTNAASLYIAGAPSNGHSVSIDNPYAIQVAGGKSLFGGNVQVYGVLTANDFLVQGNLTVQGTTTYINTQTLNVGDNIITLNADLGAVAPTENAGIEVNRGTSANVQFIWDETNDTWDIGNTAVTGYVNASSTVTGTQLVSTIATGTKPLSVTSTTLVDNLNADLLDGQHSTYYANATHTHSLTVGNGSVTQITYNASDTLHIVGGTNVSVAYDDTTNKVTISANDASIAYSELTGRPNMWYNLTDGTTTATPDAESDTFTFAQGGGLTVAVDSTNDKVTYSHADTSTVANVASDNTGLTFIQDLTLQFDTYGHVTNASVATASVTIPNNFGTITVLDDPGSGYTWADNGSVVADSTSDTLSIVSGAGIVIDVDAATDALRFSHEDTSSAANLAASGRTYVTGLTFDTYGHITAYTTGTETVTDTNTTYDLLSVANTTTGVLRLKDSANANDDVIFIGSGSVSITSNATHIAVAGVNTTYDLLAVANVAANEGILRLKDSGNANDDVKIVGSGATTLSSNATHIIVSSTDNNTTYDLVPVANTVANQGRVRLTASTLANDDVLFVGSGSITVSSNTTQVTISGVDNNTTYDLLAVANTVANEGILRLKDSGNANDDVKIVGSGIATVSSNATHIVVTATVTSANIAAALGYTPADAATVAGIETLLEAL